MTHNPPPLPTTLPSTDSGDPQSGPGGAHPPSPHLGQTISIREGDIIDIESYLTPEELHDMTLLGPCYNMIILSKPINWPTRPKEGFTNDAVSE